jgi:hypothetical protein
MMSLSTTISLQGSRRAVHGCFTAHSPANNLHHTGKNTCNKFTVRVERTVNMPATLTLREPPIPPPPAEPPLTPEVAAGLRAALRQLIRLLIYLAIMRLRGYRIRREPSVRAPHPPPPPPPTHPLPPARHPPASDEPCVGEVRRGDQLQRIAAQRRAVDRRPPRSTVQRRRPGGTPVRRLISFYDFTLHLHPSPFTLHENPPGPAPVPSLLLLTGRGGTRVTTCIISQPPTSTTDNSSCLSDVTQLCSACCMAKANPRCARDLHLSVAGRGMIEAWLFARSSHIWIKQSSPDRAPESR